MACVPFCLLVLSSLCADSAAQFVLTQPPAESVPPGQTVKLSCTRSGDSESISARYVYWYQQKPGGAPKCVIFKDTQRPSDVPSRFSGSIDSSTNSAHLSITGVQAEDDAVYYCLSYDSSSRWIFGGGTQLNILSGETKAPTLSIFPPSTEEIAGKKATVVCQCQNYYPASLVWSWTMNGQTINTGVDSTRPTKQTENNMFMAASFLSIEAVDWNASKNYTCIATHEGKSFQASVRESQCV